MLERVVSSEDGLSEEEALHRLGLVGLNRPSAAKVDPAWGIVVRQFGSSVALLLSAAIAGALLLGRSLEAAVIAAALLLNAALGFAAEFRSRRFLDSVLGSLRLDAIVLRDGRRVRVDASRLVPGDVIEVAAGERVPADARLISSAGVRVEQEALTGDATPVDKAAEPPSAVATPLGRRSSMVFAGSTVVKGSARAVVTATGPGTAAGRRGRFGRALEERVSSLKDQADLVGRWLAWVTLVVAGAAVAAGTLRGQGLSAILEVLVALAVSAVPAALLLVGAAILTISIRRMARGKVRVRHPGAVEALGRGTVVCADVVETLTSGRSRVARILTPTSQAAVLDMGVGAPGWLDIAPATPAAEAEVKFLLRATALTLDGPPSEEAAHREPLSLALWELVQDGGMDPGELLESAPLFGVIPYDEAHRMTASFRREETGPSAFIRGAPDAVLARCGSVRGPLGVRDLESGGRGRILADAQALAAEGYRVVAFAQHPTATGTEDLADPFVYVGMVGLEEGTAPQVAETVSELGRAGVRTVLLTDEDGVTAQSMARKAGVRIRDDHVVDAAGRGGPASFGPASDGATMLFWGLRTNARRRIVERLKDTGEVVVAYGSDGPASLAADATLVSGEGATDRGLAGADVVLEGGRFPAVREAIRLGRLALEDLRRAASYLLGCSVAELLVIGGAGLAGWPLPLLPLQILWLKLVTAALPSLALAAEPEEPEAMLGAQRGARTGILTRADALAVAGSGAVIALGTLAAFLVALSMGSVGRAVTVAFTTLALMQLLHIGNIRGAAFGLRFGRAEANPWLMRAVAAGLLLQLAAVYWGPLAGVLGTTPLGWIDWALALGFTAATALANRLVRVDGVEALLEGWRRHLSPPTPALAQAGDTPARSVLLFDDPPVSRQRASRVSAPTDDPWPVARAAVQAGDLPRLRALVRWYPKLVRGRDDEGTLLHHATGMPTLSWLQRGPEVVTVLVEAGADIDAGERLDGTGETPLIQAVSLNNTPVARRLLELGADPERHGRYPEQRLDTALGYALLYGRDPWFGFERGDCVELLLDWGAVASLPHMAALGRHAAVAEMLPGASVEDRQRALVFAAHRGETAVVRTCLEAGVDASRLVNFFHERLTPLLAAAGQGHLDTVQALMDAGVEPEWPEDRQGTKAMVWAWTKSVETATPFAGPRARRSRSGSK